MDQEKYIERVLSDYEERLDKIEGQVETNKREITELKMSNVEVKTKLTGIELGQEQIKLMIAENSKENQKMTLNLIEMIREDKKVDNQVRVSDRKELWALIALIIGAALSYFGLK